ncbi:MAG TPA: lysophospholipid acyltransferase family protein [Candidatus Limnocylindrales bacterium]|nr:lysophospholipid acyltransferase family protein [Candidatus Limnocylindrales bacterium]
MMDLRAMIGSILDFLSTTAESVADVASAAPRLLSSIGAEVDEKVDRIPAELNEYGYDPWGYSPKALKRFILPAAVLYRYYFRCRTTGLENLPAGRALIIGNHAGQMAFDGLMITTACILEANPPRLLRGMGEYWLGTLPYMSVLLDRTGSAVGTRQTCIDMLRHGECVMAFPEGVRGMNKIYADAYKLQEFGLGFMRLALETDTPIIPVSIVGSEEQNPGIADLKGVGRWLGMPSFPVTLTFPLLGPFGMLPLPVRYHIEFGKPMRFEGHAEDEDDVIEEKVEQVKAAISEQLERGRAARKSVFF